jgi:hypothetical protein
MGVHIGANAIIPPTQANLNADPENWMWATRQRIGRRTEADASGSSIRNGAIETLTFDLRGKRTMQPADTEVLFQWAMTSSQPAGGDFVIDIFLRTLVLLPN